jgi:Cu(I)/Ag(I) efflux system membrane protein CusA/SilA
LKYELQTVDGVSEVATIGMVRQQYQVVIDPNKLRAYDLTRSHKCCGAIQAQTANRRQRDRMARRNMVALPGMWTNIRLASAPLMVNARCGDAGRRGGIRLGPRTAAR